MPSWVVEGTEEYTKRFTDGVQLKLIELPLIRRHKAADIQRIMEKEANLIKDAIPTGSYVVALAIAGKTFSSEQLASRISQLQQANSHLCLLIGGPEGLTEKTLAACHEQWSLSKLTLPHPLARIFLIETLYRACAIINNHPYHK